MNSLLLFYRQARYSKLWKYLYFVVFILIVISAYLHWNQLLVHIVEWQKALHALLTQHIKAVAGSASDYGLALVSVSFGYGIFHAIGPGHGKAVVMTYLGTHKESLLKGAGISMSAAILQSVIAIGLVSLLARLLSFKFADIRSVGDDITLVSYVLVILLGVYITGSALYRFNRMRVASMPAKQTFTLHAPSQSQVHHAGCGCHHAHVPEAKQSCFQLFAVVLSMGLRPCSGAIIVLIYAHLVGVFYYGVAATLAMGLGTGLSVSIIALATQLARNWFETIVSDSEADSARLGRTLLCIRLFGGILLVFIGWGLLNAALQVNGSHPLI